MYHGIILDFEFTNTKYPEQFKIFAKRKSSSNNWTLFGIEVPNDRIEFVIADIRANMKFDKPYYAHLYNDNDLLVVFKEKVFKVKPHNSTWGKVLAYGKQLGIPKEQMNIWPNRFQDEINYFKPEDFV